MKNTGMFLVLLWVCLMFTSSISYDFEVGGKSGWDLESSHSYPEWSSKSRFQINDNLVFTYEKKGESILEVSDDHFTSCETHKPIETLQGGHSAVRLNRPGPFYFISGDSDLCHRGLKLNITVMGRHPPHHHPSKAPEPAPASEPAQAPGSNAAAMQLGGASLAVTAAVAMVVIVNSIWFS